MTVETALTPETLNSAHSTAARTAFAVERTTPRPTPSNAVASVGFALFCVFVLSGFANDWSLRLFGTKAYLSAVTLFLLPLAWIFSGNAWRGLRSGIGLCWGAFLLWMLLSTPLSVWRGGSAIMLANYIPRAYLEFFYTCAFVTSLRRCRQWMYVQIVSGAALVLTCAAFGRIGDDPDDSRFRIPHSLFYANSNDLALALLLAISAFLFLFHGAGRIRKLAGMVGIALAASYAFRTGSRGGVIAAVALGLLIFLLTRNRSTVAMIGTLVAGVALASGIGGGSTSALHRLSLLMSDPSAPARTESDEASVASQAEREELFKTSLRYTLSHPLFGVGPDQFASAVNEEAERTGRHMPWLGTHNTYTQVSSECGIPALIAYLAVMLLSLRSNLRLYWRTCNRAEWSDVAALSRCLLAGTVVFAISAFFFHMAYSAYLPALAGFTVALQAVAAPSEVAPLTRTKRRS